MFHLLLIPCGILFTILFSFVVVKSYWSLLVDLVFQVHVQVTKLTAYNVLQFIMFASIETNGLQLVAGIVETICTNINIYTSKVLEQGIYKTFSDIAKYIAQKRNISGNVYTASTNNRFTHNNSCPLECSCTNGIHTQSNRGCCINKETTRIYNCCRRLHNTVYNIGGQRDQYSSSLQSTSFSLSYNNTSSSSTSSTSSRRKKRKSRSTNKAQFELEYDEKDQKMDILMSTFMNDIQKRKGIAHVVSCSFVQAASFFGFIPVECMSYSSIGSATSGGFKFLQHCLQTSSPNTTLTPEYAQKIFVDAKHKLDTLYNTYIPLCLLENLLCELWRSRNNGFSPKKDVYCLSNTRNSMQNLFRFRFHSSKKISIEIQPSMPECKFLSLPKSTGKRLTKKEICRWEIYRNTATNRNKLDVEDHGTEPNRSNWYNGENMGQYHFGFFSFKQNASDIHFLCFSNTLSLHHTISEMYAYKKNVNNVTYNMNYGPKLGNFNNSFDVDNEDNTTYQLGECGYARCGSERAATTKYNNNLEGNDDSSTEEVSDYEHYNAYMQNQQTAIRTSTRKRKPKNVTLRQMERRTSTSYSSLEPYHHYDSNVKNQLPRLSGTSPIYHDYANNNKVLEFEPV